MIRRTLFWFATLALAMTATAAAKGPAKFMMATEVDGKKLEGQPLLWDQRQMFMLGRDGELYDFATKQAQNSRKIAQEFPRLQHRRDASESPSGIRPLVCDQHDQPLRSRASTWASGAPGPTGWNRSIGRSSTT